MLPCRCFIKFVFQRVKKDLTTFFCISLIFLTQNALAQNRCEEAARQALNVSKSYEITTSNERLTAYLKSLKSEVTEKELLDILMVRLGVTLYRPKSEFVEQILNLWGQEGSQVGVQLNHFQKLFKTGETFDLLRDDFGGFSRFQSESDFQKTVLYLYYWLAGVQQVGWKINFFYLLKISYYLNIKSGLYDYIRNPLREDVQSVDYRLKNVELLKLNEWAKNYLINSNQSVKFVYDSLFSNRENGAELFNEVATWLIRGLLDGSLKTAEERSFAKEFLEIGSKENNGLPFSQTIADMFSKGVFEKESALDTLEYAKDRFNFDIEEIGKSLKSVKDTDIEAALLSLAAQHREEAAPQYVDLLVEYAQTENTVAIWGSTLSAIKEGNYVLSSENLKSLKKTLAAENLSKEVETNILGLASRHAEESIPQFFDIVLRHITRNGQGSWSAVASVLNEKGNVYIDSIVDRYFIDQPVSKISDYEVLKKHLTEEKGDYFSSRFAEKLSHKVAGLNAREKSHLEAAIPELRHLNSLAILSVLRPSDRLEESVAHEILRNQSRINESLLKELSSVINANAPPTSFARWGDFVSQLPERVRHDFVRDLLIKNSSSTRNFASIVEQLDPLPGTGKVIATVLRNEASALMNGNRSQFSHDQLNRMFSGHRFGQFFPWLHHATMEGGMRTKFILGVFIGGESENLINSSWVRQKLDSDFGDIRRGVREALGFRPAMSPMRLRNQMAEMDNGRTAYRQDEQYRGLIVQGAYEKVGYSMMERTFERGDQQLEDQAPRLMNRIESSLRDDSLSRQSPRVQRHFVYAWELTTGGTLIENIRNRAEWIAGRANRFWQLRVEIHNFPTINVLRRVKNYRDRFNGRQNIRDQLDFLISEIERLLGLNRRASESVTSLIDNLASSDTSKLTLKEMSSGYEQATFTERLSIISGLRDQFFEIKRVSNSNRRMIERLLGDRELAQLAMVEAERAINDFSGVTSKSDLVKLTELAEGMVQHIRRSDQVTEEQAKTHLDELKRVIENSDLPLERQTTLTLDILSSLVNQVHYVYMREFGAFDFRYARVAERPEGSGPPILFVDRVLRSSMTFSLSRLVDKVQTSRVEQKNIRHLIVGELKSDPIEVFNPGEVVGVIRFNKDPMSLTKDEIGVFSDVPAETGALGGIVTLGIGARLSHLQLLAKSLGIPNIKMSSKYEGVLRSLDGKWVKLKADKSGQIELVEINDGRASLVSQASNVVLPTPDHSVQKPISFERMKDYAYRFVAGPKGIQLSRLFNESSLKGHVEDGVIIPFGFFNRYADAVGLTEWMNLLSKTDLRNSSLVALISGKISNIIRSNSLPEEMLNEVMSELNGLQQRTNHKGGYFFRSDTHIEDLPNFNGAGLNESVPNVLNHREAVDQAVRQVWISPFKEKSIYWRAMALSSKTVTISEPSVVFMPTVSAETSGVIISKGTDQWLPGKGLLSANWGIGSVVEAGKPVEEITLEVSEPLRYGFTVSTQKPTASENGGLTMSEVRSGIPVMTSGQIQKLNSLSIQVEKILGEQSHGWDIEWAVDQSGAVKILQARPNM